MKILHTSDLHIGHNFFGVDRFKEYEKFFGWLRDVIKNEKIEVLLISGDVFDVYMPSSQALRQYFEFLISLKNVRVIITGGNHDSPNTLLAPKSILKKIDVEVISGAEDDYVRVIEFDKFNILAVSYLREGIIEKNGGFKEAFKNIYKPLSKPTIAMGHMTVYGSKSSGSERDIYIGKIEGVSADIFDGFAYTALGHIHKPQEIKKGVVYSGSPLQMSFDENYQKKVVVIDTENFSYKFVDVPKFREFIRIKGKYDKILGIIEKLRAGTFVEIELEEVVDSLSLDMLRKDEINVVKIKMPFVEITPESVDVEKITPKALIKSIFENDKDLEEILSVVDELGERDED